jgi:DUF917 family protein
MAAAHAVADHLGGAIVDVGTVESVRLEVTGGYDVGTILVAGRQGRRELTFWNEYMTLETDGQRTATFPDLMTTLNPKDGTPLASAEIEQGMRVAILTAPRTRLVLGAGMRDPQLFEDIEHVVGKEILRYVFSTG